MKNIIIGIALLIFTSCSNTPSKEKEFETLIGEELTLGLNKSVDIFEEMLAEYYQSEKTSSLYIRFLHDVRTETIDWGKLHNGVTQLEDFKQVVYQSGLYDELVFKFGGITDSNDWFVERKYYYQPKHSQVPVDSTTIGTTYRQLDSNFNNKGDIEYIHNGKIQYALSCIENDNKTVKDYLEVKRLAGIIKPELMAGGLLNYEPLEVDYFIKRIIVNEFLLYITCKSIYDEKS